MSEIGPKLGGHGTYAHDASGKRSLAALGESLPPAPRGLLACGRVPSAVGRRRERLHLPVAAAFTLAFSFMSVKGALPPGSSWRASLWVLVPVA